MDSLALNSSSKKLIVTIYISVVYCLICSGQFPALQTHEYSIKKYTTSNSDLAHDRIDNLHFDDENNLYCMTPNGYNKILNWNTKYPIFESSKNLEIYKDNFLDQKGHIFHIGRNRILNKLSEASSSAFFPDNEEKILDELKVGSNEFAILYESGKLFFIRHQTDYDSLQVDLNFDNRHFEFLAIDKERNIYLSIKQTDYFKKTHENPIYQFSPSGEFVDTIHGSVENRLQIHLKNFNPSFLLRNPNVEFNPDFNKFMTNNLLDRGVTFFRKAFYDKNSQLFWYLDQDYFQLVGIHHSKGIVHKIPLSDKRIIYSSILFSEGNILIATTKGLIHVKITENKFSNIYIKYYHGFRRIKKKLNGEYNISTDDVLLQIDTNFNLIQAFNSHYILFASSFTDSKDNIWVNFEGTIYIYNKDYQLINSIRKKERKSFAQQSNFNWGFWESKDGTVWTIINDTMVSYKELQEVQEVPINLTKKTDIFEVIEKDSTYFWVCTSNGLLKTNRFTGESARFSNQEKGSYFLPCQDVHDLLIDKKGNYWIASGSNGLIKWNYKETDETSPENQPYSYQIFNTQFDFPTNIITGLEEDDFGFLWISTENGLIRLHKNSHNFEVFTTENGILDNEFNRLSHYKDDKGIMYFGGLNGVAVFDPKSFIHEKQSQKIHIKKIYEIFQNKKKEITNLFKSEPSINFNHKEKGLEIIYGYNNAVKSDKVYYKINGNGSWVKADKYKISLLNLPLGASRIYIKLENIKGETVDQQVILVKIPYLYYSSICFFIFSMIGIFIIAYGFYKWRTVRLQQRQEELEIIIEERTTTIEKQKIQLEEQIESKSRFFRNLAHELRTPLTLIDGSTSLIEANSNLDLNNRDKNLLSTIKQNSNSILKISNEILLLSQLQSNNYRELDNSPVSVLLFFERLFSTFSLTAEEQEKNYTFEHNLSSDSTIALDTGKVEKIVLNLISNAIKYSSKGDTIILNVQQDQHKKNLQIEVKDTGVGIAQADMTSIFAPFTRHTSKNDTGYGLNPIEGVGIGLTIVKELVDLCKGKIQVSSTISEGSSFLIDMPYEEAKYAQLVDSHENTIIESSFTLKPLYENHHLLIIEDSKDLSSFLEKFLEQHFQVSIANNTSEAFEILSLSSKRYNNQSISLIISDLLMPNEYGIDFIKKIKKNVEWKTIPVIITSSDNTESNKTQAQNLGIQYFLPKPFNPYALLNCIYKSLESDTVNDADSLIEDISYSDELSQTINEAILQNLDNSEFNLDLLSDLVSIGKRQLIRTVKQKTGLTPIKYITELRLRKAKELLKDNSTYTVSEIAYAVGFKSPNYFSKLFKSRFGRLPSSYIKN